MVHIDLVDGGYQLNRAILFAAQTPVEGMVNLAKEQGEPMSYDKKAYTYVDYPGEYDLQWVFIKVIADKHKLLNYIMHENDSVYALIQSPLVLEEDDFADVQTIIYTDDRVANKIEQLELEVEKIKLETVVS